LVLGSESSAHRLPWGRPGTQRQGLEFPAGRLLLGLPEVALAAEVTGPGGGGAVMDFEETVRRWREQLSLIAGARGE
jgi:hypothetical protein